MTFGSVISAITRMGAPHRGQRPGKGEHPLAHRDTGQDVVEEVGGAVDQAPCAARGTESSFSTAESDDVLVSTARALDSMLLRVSPERYWVSIADSDLMLFYKGLAAGLRLDVAVREPEVSPPATQGPRAQTLVARLWGEQAARIGLSRNETA